MSCEESWWALALTEEVNGKKPLSVDIGDQPVVLWRDSQGIARALEDRCPHRRAPLSLGRIRDNGWLQCGYHGWTYDGESGKLCEIPNLKNQQRFAPVYCARHFAVHEADGFVKVCLNETAAAPSARGTAMPLSGTVHVPLDHGEYLTALFDDPTLLLEISGVQFTPYPISDLHEENGRLIMERNCQWKVLHWPAPFSSDYPLTVRTATDPVTGETELILRNRALQDLMTLVLAPVPTPRGVTAIRWRAALGQHGTGLFGLLSKLRSPVQVRTAIDAGALRKLKPSASAQFIEMRYPEHRTIQKAV
ncbi:MAG: Rieske 2Fe-2S domain-containing protein [Alphaproteobacteria bacterium]|nr:Rieske 2Fe-2S domain-containing protein [Alphaproteobacteria bacterium]